MVVRWESGRALWRGAAGGLAEVNRKRTMQRCVRLLTVVASGCLAMVVVGIRVLAGLATATTAVGEPDHPLRAGCDVTDNAATFGSQFANSDFRLIDRARRSTISRVIATADPQTFVYFRGDTCHVRGQGA